jgi:hypothetical protein
MSADYPLPRHQAAERPSWDRLAADWGLTIEDMPAVVRYLIDQLAVEDGTLVTIEQQLRASHTRFVYLDPTTPGHRIAAERPTSWTVKQEARALEMLREVLAEPLDFGRREG